MTEKPLVQIIEEGLSSPDLKLPVFNKIAIQLQELINTDDYNGSDLAKLIEKDQALTAHILKVANSAFYTGLQPVKTIQAAILRLGSNSLTNIVHLVSQKDMYKTRVKGFQDWMRQLWLHSLGTAIAAKWLANNLGYNSVAEEAFMAGLMHDIGKLIHIRIWDELLTKQAIQSQLSTSLLMEIAATMHATHGSHYLEKQNLPEIYISVAAHHHDEEIGGEKTVLNLVRLANKTCHKLGIGLTSIPDLMLSTTPEAINLMAKDLLLAELQVTLEENMRSLDSVV